MCFERPPDRCERVVARPALDHLTAGDPEDVDLLRRPFATRGGAPSNSATWRPLTVARTTTLSPSAITSRGSSRNPANASCSAATVARNPSGPTSGWRSHGGRRSPGARAHRRDRGGHRSRPRREPEHELLLGLDVASRSRVDEVSGQSRNTRSEQLTCELGGEFRSVPRVSRRGRAWAATGATLDFDPMVTNVGRLLERDRELQRIGAMLDSAATRVPERPSCSKGSAGIGKTRLARAVRQEAAERGFLSLAARGTELERDYPFGVVRQLLEPTLRGRRPAERARLLDGAAALAGQRRASGGGSGGRRSRPGFRCTAWALLVVREPCGTAAAVARGRRCTLGRRAVAPLSQLPYPSGRDACTGRARDAAIRRYGRRGARERRRRSDCRYGRCPRLRSHRFSACAPTALSIRTSPTPATPQRAATRSCLTNSSRRSSSRRCRSRRRRRTRRHRSAPRRFRQRCSGASPGSAPRPARSQGRPRCSATTPGSRSPPNSRSWTSRRAPKLLPRLPEWECSRTRGRCDSSIRSCATQSRRRCPAGERVRLHRRAAELLAADGAPAAEVAVHLLPTDPGAGDPGWSTRSPRLRARLSPAGLRLRQSRCLRVRSAEPPPDSERVALCSTLAASRAGSDGRRRSSISRRRTARRRSARARPLRACARLGADDRPGRASAKSCRWWSARSRRAARSTAS